jgi:pimeloyl-ACP methyl ester carboxylesterase
MNCQVTLIRCHGEAKKSKEQTQMTTYVLVGGAWIGGWAWRDVARRLRAEGHEVYPLTLTGLGDRVHLANPEVNLETHIADIVNTLESEDLHDVVLLAHSYASVPVTGAADRARERITRLVYLDTAPISNGLSLFETYPPEAQQLIQRLCTERGDGWRFPMPTWEELQSMGSSVDGVRPQQRDQIRARSAPQPLGTYTQPLRLTRADAEPLPKLGILCSFSEVQMRQMIDAGHPWGKELTGPEWRFVELPTGHWPMFSKPAELVEILNEVGR